MAKLKFIHAADLHIESPYRGISQLNPELGERLIDLGFKAFDKLINTCISENIDFLLIAGDSFDSADAGLSAQYRFIRGLQKLNEHQIPVYIVCGNHDPLENWIDSINLPENVHVFPGAEPSKVVYEKEGQPLAHIYGASFEKSVEDRSLAEYFKVEDTKTFSVGLLHGTFAGRENKNPYCPMTMDQLKRSGMHYWALGHIHKREIINEQKPMVVYSGNLQGRHFNETGSKGVYLMEVDSNRSITPTFIPLSEVVFLREELILGDEETLTSLANKIEDLKFKLKEDYGSVLLRLTLKGSTQLFGELSETAELNEWVNTLNESVNYHEDFVFVSRIENETRPLINWEERQKGDDFVADLLRRYEHISEDETLQNEMIEKILEEINSSNVFRKLKKYELHDNFPIQNIFEQAKIKSISELIATKHDHQ